MSAQEKAKDLFEKFYDETPNEAWFNEPVGISNNYNARNMAKQCSVIAVDEILSFLNELDLNENGKIRGIYEQDYWQQVKEEINKL